MKEMVGGCCVCSDDRGWPDNPLVYCDGNGCTVAVHQACYGIVSVPTGPWYCRKCESEERQNRVRCELCPCRFGALKRSDRDGWAHVVCALYIPEVRFGNVTSMEPIILHLVPPERFNKTCYICQEKGKTGRSTVGACMQCNKTGCKQQFHVTCAQALGLLCEEAGNYLDNVKYCGYCQHHYSKLKKGGNVKTIPPYKPIPQSDSPSSSDSGPEKDAETPCPTGTSGAQLATGSSKTSKTKKSTTPSAKTAHGGKPSMMSTLTIGRGHHSTERAGSKKSSPNCERRPSLHDSSSNEGSDIAPAVSAAKDMNPQLQTASTSTIVTAASAIEIATHKGGHTQPSITGAIQPTPGVATNKPDVPTLESERPSSNSSGTVLQSPQPPLPAESVITNTEFAANPDSMKQTKKRRAAQAAAASLAAAALAAKNNVTSNETSTITYTSMWDAPQSKANAPSETIATTDKTKKTRSLQSPINMGLSLENIPIPDAYNVQQTGRPTNSPSRRPTDVDRRNAEIERRNSAADLDRRNAEYDRRSAEYERAASAERERRTADRERVVREMGPPPNPNINNSSGSAHSLPANYTAESHSSPSHSPMSGRGTWGGLQVSYEPQAGTSSIGAVPTEPTDLVKRSSMDDHSLKIAYEPQKTSYDLKPGPSALMPPPVDTLDHRKSRGSRGNEMSFDLTPPAAYVSNDPSYSRKRSSNEMLSMPPMPVRQKKRATPTHTITSAECVSTQLNLQHISLPPQPSPASQRLAVPAAYQDLTASPSPEPAVGQRSSSPSSDSIEQTPMSRMPAALHMLGNELNPASEEAEGLSEQLRDELAAQTDAFGTEMPAQEPLVLPPLINKAASLGQSTFSDRSSSTGTHSLDQLLERQWEQGSQFLMEQAQHFDIASLLSCLHQLRTENVRLEEHVDNLLQRRDHLLAVNARLAIPLTASSAANGDARKDGRTGVLRNDTGITSAERAQQMVLRELQQKPS